MNIWSQSTYIFWAWQLKWSWEASSPVIYMHSCLGMVCVWLRSLKFNCEVQLDCEGSASSGVAAFACGWRQLQLVVHLASECPLGLAWVDVQLVSVHGTLA